jgi:large subunit ribosomal protein L7/L12
MNTRRWSPEIQALGDQIVGLTASRAAELQKYLEVVHGITSVTTPVIERVKVEELPPPPPTEFQVVLQGFDPTRKVSVIRAARELLGLGIREARDLVDSHPRVVREGLTREEADKVKALLEAAGAVVSVVEVVVVRV